MQNLRSPKWVFLVTTAPVAVFMAVCAGEYGVIHTLLPAEAVAGWQGFGAALGLLLLGTAGLAIAQLLRRQPLRPWYSVAVLLSFSLFLCLLTWRGTELLPLDVPRWMVPTDPFLMAWTFLMPTLAHAMLALVAYFTPDDRPHQAAINFGLAALMPIGWGMVYQIGSWLSQLLPDSLDNNGISQVWHWWQSTMMLMIIVLVLATLSFFFFLTRGLFIIAQRRPGRWADGSIAWKIVITIVLPLLGLGVNNGLFFGQGFRDMNGIFGNFVSPWFYLLALANGLLLCLPDSRRPALRLAQLLGRSVLFGYTFYFFLVFLPFLPLAIPGILLIGTGFLVLAPLLLFVLHVRQLSDDVTALRATYAPALTTAVLLAGLATLPLYFTASFWHRRQVLHEALAYVYTPDYAHPAPPLDAPALAATLAAVRQNKDRGTDLFFGSQQPYLSTYFNWLVLDNLMLSDQKIQELELIFTGSPPASSQLSRGSVTPPPTGPDEGATLNTRPEFIHAAADPQLRSATASSRFDAAQQAWVSWVSLEIANPNLQSGDGEYYTLITLPEGCWVSDYVLTIGNRQEHGILAEKKAAEWVFAQILNEHQSRDPGLLSYRGPNEVAVRVYPVSGAEVRRTRIQLLHKEPFTLTIDGHRLVLGDSTTAPVTAPVAVPGGNVAYLSAAAKAQLPLVQRRPYYHFLLDASAPQATASGFRERVGAVLARPLPNGASPRFSLVSAATVPLVAGADWAAALGQQPASGGYYLGGAMRRVLFEAQARPAATYPVLVAVTNHFNQAILDADFEDFRAAYPESGVFYVLGADGRLVPHSLRHAARQPLSSSPAPGAPVPVRAWPNAAHPRAYLSAAPEASVVVSGRPAMGPAAGTPAASRWLTGLLLRGYGQWQSFHPEATDHERVPFVQASFRAGIMTPFTSFLALEDEAQKAALRRKQTQTLAANASLDAMEQEKDLHQPTTTPLDSAVLLLLAAGLLLAGWQLRQSARG